MKWDLGQFAKIKHSLAGILPPITWDLLPSLPPLCLSAQLSFLDPNQWWQRVEGGTKGKQNLLVLLDSSHPCYPAQINRISWVQWCSVEWGSKVQTQGCVGCSPLANSMFHTAASLPRNSPQLPCALFHFVASVTSASWPLVPGRLQWVGISLQCWTESSQRKGKVFSALSLHSCIELALRHVIKVKTWGSRWDLKPKRVCKYRSWKGTDSSGCSVYTWERPEPHLHLEGSEPSI